jgi:ribonuclease HI
MNASLPQYLLFCDLGGHSDPCRWRFVLRSVDGSYRFEADDVEPDARGERLELLTVVRGLEAIDRPSHVTLITASSYVREGIRRGIAEWRKNGWRWERFGQMVPVKNLDLWQRIDRALRYHQIDCRTYRLDPPHAVHPSEEADAEDRREQAPKAVPTPGGEPLEWRRATFVARLRGWLASRLASRAG